MLHSTLKLASSRLSQNELTPDDPEFYAPPRAQEKSGRSVDSGAVAVNAGGECLTVCGEWLSVQASPVTRTSRPENPGHVETVGTTTLMRTYGVLAAFSLPFR